MFKTTDGGETWNDVSINNVRMWSCYFLDRDNGIAVGGGCTDKQQFHKTTDGGNNWTTYKDSVPSSGLTDAILYSSNGLGYASSSGKIWKTEDGGLSWNVFSESGNYDWQEDIAYEGNTFLLPFSVGCSGGLHSGGMRISTDNGNNWNEFKIENSMFGTFLLDPSRGWAVGRENAVYYTNDGGENWQLSNTGIDSLLSFDDVWFINDTTGWIVGDGVYKFKGNLATSVSDADTKNNGKMINTISPNPVNDFINTDIYLEYNSNLNVKLLNITGNELLHQELELIPKGLHHLQTNFNNQLQNLPSGMYFLIFDMLGKREIEKIVIYR